MISVGSHEPPLTIAPLLPGEESEWKEFLARSANATLFHSLDFLAYHRRGRFQFHHLLIRQLGKLVALIPGGLVGRPEAPIFTSPLGASIGGFVLLPGARLSTVLSMIEALQMHSEVSGWAGIEITIPPAVYASEVGEVVAFALFGRGFVLKHRWLCPMLPIKIGKPERYRTLFRSRAAEHVRSARRAGVVVEEHGVEALPDFINVFEDTYKRHGVAATHDASEIEDLLKRLPQQVRLFVARQDKVPIAGFLIMMLSTRIAYSFYICASSRHAAKRGNLVAFAMLLDWLGDRGYEWLDLGPGSSDRNFDHGVMFFKEGLGAIGYNRDQWTWNSRSNFYAFEGTLGSGLTT